MKATFTHTAKRGALLLALLMVASAFVPVDSAAARPQTWDHQVPMVGIVMGLHEVDRPPGPDGWTFTSFGSGWVFPLGRVDYHLEQDSTFGPDGLVTSSGTITFTARRGTLVIAQDMTSEIVGAMEGFTMEATWTVVDGSGRFADATGSGSLRGAGDIPGGGALYGLPDGHAVFGFRGAIDL